jgi:hypothetical protein
VDLIREAAKVALGYDRRFTDYPNSEGNRQHACSVNFVPEWHQPRAILAALDLDPAMLASPAYAASGFFYPLGTLLRLPPEATQYLGWLVAVGPSQAAAEEELRALVAKVHYSLVSPSAHQL